MAIIHRTTLSPTKLELVAPWLTTRPWYRGAGAAPVLSRSGGFRLDDPRGEVGLEFMVVTDESGERPVSYHVPLTYRGAPLDGAEDALVGTTEHGVLGRRWVYDGVHDPVLGTELLALLQGRAEPQAQSLTDTPDPTVAVRFDGAEVVTGPLATTVADDADGTRMTMAVGTDAGDARLTVQVSRVLRPGAPPPGAATGQVTAGWRHTDGEEIRAVFASLHVTASTGG
ncbi:1,4-alpha-glucan branching protein [Streptomyces sp. NPDC048664]|uniref:maltokinase N-terminal cap-like domain-containing protein n=1 Tax=Streptomyces sp. NPDC048664 TaxID=3154505 RepID=UPI00341779E2